jgi:hypothetical protein
MAALIWLSGFWILAVGLWLGSCESSNLQILNSCKSALIRWTNPGRFSQMSLRLRSAAGRYVHASQNRQEASITFKI